MIALPMLDAMRPIRALAGGIDQAKSPVRMAFLFVPNGAHMPDWIPAAEGADFDLPYILQPLQAHKSELLVLSGLTQDKGRSNGDGGGDHARSAGSWLTGVQPLKSEGSRIRVGTSADQVAASHIGRATRFESLELGLEPGRQGGKCDTGYSCAYSNNISWRNESTPMTREINPRLVFERLFSNEMPKDLGAAQKRRELAKKSILDFVLEDAKSLSAKVGGHDREKLDEYLTAVREIELRVDQAAKTVASANTSVAAGYEIPEGIPESYEEHARLMCDMMVLAFQSDTTRVCTFMLANEGSNRAYRNVGANDGHHSLSHHQGDHAKQMKIREINRFHIQQYAYLVQRLEEHPGRRRHAAGSLHDRLRRRPRGWKSACAQQPSPGARRPRRRNAFDWEASRVPGRDADVQPPRLHAGTRWGAGGAFRRQHWRLARPGRLSPVGRTNE
jgi:hypothetical protein